ncbi:MAG: hypothetical protein AB1646_16855 [Thermodesulfobacteriota bacterium]
MAVKRFLDDVSGCTEEAHELCRHASTGAERCRARLQLRAVLTSFADWQAGKPAPQDQADLESEITFENRYVCTGKARILLGLGGFVAGNGFLTWPC